MRDNGRGIPIDPHPRFPGKSALEVILTTLHSGGKFGGNAYKTSGGLHGVGVSVVNALSDGLAVEVARDRRLWRQRYRGGVPEGPVEDCGPVHNRRGTTLSFHPDPEIFADAAFRPALLYRMARSKAYLFRGVEIRWRVDPIVPRPDGVPQEARLHFPGGLGDYLSATLADRPLLTPRPFIGQADFPQSVTERRRTGRTRGPAASNGRSSGPRTKRTGSVIPIATRSRPPKAARTRPGCATQCCAASAPMPS